jgi:type IV pilus assembly protein PilN
MRLNINLASRPYEDAGRFWMRWGSALAAAGTVTLIILFFAVSGWVSARSDRKQIAAYKAQIAERDKERADAEAFLNLPANRSTRDRSQFLNALIERKAFSWTKVFEELEKVMPPRLHVVSIHPEMDANNQLQLKIVVAGESTERAIDLMRRMESSPHFSDIRELQEQHQPGQIPGDNVSYDITAHYVVTPPPRSEP